MNVKSIAGQFSKFLKLYGESLQALVQGYREVTMDSTNSYQFDDKMTVQQKLDRFENRLRAATTGVQEKVKKKYEEKMKKWMKKWLK